MVSKERRHVTHREALIGIVVALGMAGPFAYWIIGEARAAASSNQTVQQVINEQVVDRLRRMEDKLDEVGKRMGIP